MDIVTHGMIGVALAAPLAASHPEAAAGFALGSVLPDLDAFSRLLGKRTFMRVHQGYTHSLPLILAAGAALFAALFAIEGPALLAAGIAAGMVLHSMLDLTNTYGIMVLAPFTRKRFSLEWVFFIDLVMLAALAPLLAYTAWGLYSGAAVSPLPVTAFVCSMGVYWALKAILRARAGFIAHKGTRSLVPDTFRPWIYHGYRLEGREAVLFEINAFNGRISKESRLLTLDARWIEALENVPEFREMRRLSLGFHVVSAQETAEGTLLKCRDLRTRNFGGAFGGLEVVVGPDRSIKKTDFHV